MGSLGGAEQHLTSGMVPPSQRTLCCPQLELQAIWGPFRPYGDYLGEWRRKWKLQPSDYIGEWKRKWERQFRDCLGEWKRNGNYNLVVI